MGLSALSSCIAKALDLLYNDYSLEEIHFLKVDQAIGRLSQ